MEYLEVSRIDRVKELPAHSHSHQMKHTASASESMRKYLEELQVDIAQLSDKQLENLLQLSQDWSATQGLVVAPQQEDAGKFLWQGAAMTLVPSPVPRSCYEFGKELSPLISLLFHRIAHDPTFLNEALQSVITGDEFTRKLVEIYDTCRCENNGGFQQKASLGIYRSDYMLDVSFRDPEKQEGLQARILQVEVNAVSAAFSGLGHLAANWHKFLVASRPQIFSHLSLDNMPDNDSHLLVPNALHRAHRYFIQDRQRAYGDRREVVLFVGQPGERNRIDQRHIEFGLFDRFGVLCVRSSLIELYDNARLTEDKDLVITHLGEEIVISVVYFRAGYTPDDFKSDKEWEARLLLERSTAVKAPSIAYHLCGTKRVQQVLTEPGVLERFFSDSPEAVEKLRSSFAGIYDLDPQGNYQDKHKEASDHPERFVVKPQREGGGTLVFGDKIVDALRDWDEDKLKSHILMERINPVASPNYLLLSGKMTPQVQVVPEIGFFHAFLGTSDHEELLNETHGYLVRTKPMDVEDGGVAAGRAALDSIYLYDLPE